MKYEQLVVAHAHQAMLADHEMKSLPPGSTRQLQLRYELIARERCRQLLETHGTAYEETLAALHEDLTQAQAQFGELDKSAIQIRTVLGAQIEAITALISDIEAMEDGRASGAYIPL